MYSAVSSYHSQQCDIGVMTESGRLVLTFALSYNAKFSNPHSKPHSPSAPATVDCPTRVLAGSDSVMVGACEGRVVPMMREAAEA